MGSLLSHSNEKGGSTPLRSSHSSTSSSPSPSWCRLENDPRSPTEGIDRTPILVNPAPEPEINPVDPRSPTVGITRTPLQLGAQPQQQMAREVGEAKEAGGAVDAEEEEQQKQEEEQGGSQEDSKVEMPDLQGLSLSDVDESSCLLPAAQQGGRKPVGWRTSTQSSLKPAVQPKQLFQCGDLSPILAVPPPPNPPHSRPLSLKARDTNSPRAVVQRKAIRKVEANRQNMADSPAWCVAVDKENWHH